MDEQPIALCLQSMMCPDQSLGSRPLQKGSGLRVHWRAQKIPVCGVADVEFDRGIECGQLRQLRFAKLSRLFRRLGGKSILEHVFKRPLRMDAKNSIGSRRFGRSLT